MRYLPKKFFENVVANGRYGGVSEGLFHGNIVLRVVDDDYIGVVEDIGWYHLHLTRKITKIQHNTSAILKPS